MIVEARGMFERKVYAGGLAFSVVLTLAGAYSLFQMWRIGAPASLLAALVLALAAVALTGYTALRARKGIRPVQGDRISVALKLLSAGIFLSLFGPRIWAAL